MYTASSHPAGWRVVARIIFIIMKTSRIASSALSLFFIGIIFAGKVFYLLIKALFAWAGLLFSLFFSFFMLPL